MTSAMNQPITPIIYTQTLSLVINKDGKVTYASHLLMQAGMPNYEQFEINLRDYCSESDFQLFTSLFDLLCPEKPAAKAYFDFSLLPNTTGPWLAEAQFEGRGHQPVSVRLSNTQDCGMHQGAHVAVDQLEEAFFTIDLQKRCFVEASHDFYGALGYSMVRQRPFCQYPELFHPENWEELQNTLAYLAKPQNDKTFFMARLVHVSGKVYPYLVHMRVVSRSVTGKPLMVSGKAFKAEHAESQLAFRRLLDAHLLDMLPDHPNRLYLLMGEDGQVLDRSGSIRLQQLLFDQPLTKQAHVGELASQGLQEGLKMAGVRYLQPNLNVLLKLGKHYVDLRSKEIQATDGSRTYLMWQIEDVTQQRQFKQLSKKLADRLQEVQRIQPADTGTGLSESERWQPLLQNKGFYFMTVSPGLEVKELSKSLSDFHRQQHGHLHLSELIAPTDWGNVSEVLEQILAKPALWQQKTLEFRLSHNEKKWLMCTVLIQKNADGSLRELIFVGQDITKYKQDESNYWISNERFQLIARATNDAIMDWNIITNRVWVNQGFYQLTGLNQFQKPSLNHWMLHIHPEDRTEIIRNLRDVVDHRQETWKGEYRLLLSNGEYGHIYHRALLKTDGHGNPTRLLNTLMDVTDRVNFEQELIRVKERYDMAVKAGKTGIWEWKRHQGEILIDDNLAIMIGKELEGSSYSIPDWKAIVHPEDHAILKEAFNHVMDSPCQSEEIMEATIRVKNEIGELKWVLIRGRLLMDELEGKDGYKMVGTGTDITDYKQVEEKLVNAKRDIELAMRDKEQFFSVMSHEIRTPLNAVIGMTYLLAREESPKKRETLLNTLKFSADNLLALINDILDYNKIQAGKLDFEKSDFNLQDLVNSIKVSHTPIAEDKGLFLNLQIGPDVPEIVNGDATRLGQILNNLVSNALKFTHEGGVNIEVASVNLLKRKKVLKFVVRDTGIGIPKSKQEKIFLPFDQGGSDTAGKYGGTGLGLSIVKNLVELQKGKLQLKSRDKVGTTFEVTLSFRAASRHNKKLSKQVLPQLSQLGVENIKVLYVEDVIPNQILLESLLANWGLDLDLVSSGEEAIAAVQKNDYDLVLMDVQMPGMNGYQATKKIRALGGSQAIMPIVAVTAEVSEKAKRLAINAGMNDYIIKPIVPANLYKILQYYISERGALAVAPGPDQKGDQQEVICDDIQPEIEVVDFSDSDTLFGNNTASYANFLNVTTKSFREAEEGLVTALRRKDVEMYRMHDHKLKGVLHFLKCQSFMADLGSIKGQLINNPEALNVAEAIQIVAFHFNKLRSVFSDKERQLN